MDDASTAYQFYISYCYFFLQVLPLFTLKMRGMLKMLFGDLITCHLVMIDADCLWNGLGLDLSHYILLSLLALPFGFMYFRSWFISCSEDGSFYSNFWFEWIRVNEVVIVMGPSQWQIRGQQKPCL